MSVRSLLKLNKGKQNTFWELKSYFCKSLTEFYQISLKILPNLTDFSSQLMACMNMAGGQVTEGNGLQLKKKMEDFVQSLSLSSPVFQIQSSIQDQISSHFQVSCLV